MVVEFYGNCCIFKKTSITLNNTLLYIHSCIYTNLSHRIPAQSSGGPPPAWRRLETTPKLLPDLLEQFELPLYTILQYTSWKLSSSLSELFFQCSRSLVCCCVKKLVLYSLVVVSTSMQARSTYTGNILYSKQPVLIAIQFFWGHYMIFQSSFF